MKLNFSVLLILFFASATVGFAQEGNVEAKPNDIPEPLVILKTSGIILEIDPAQGDTLNLSAIKSESIASVDVISGDSAKEGYGEKGNNGVIVITLKDNYIVTKESVIKLRAPEE